MSRSSRMRGWCISFRLARRSSVDCNISWVYTDGVTCKHKAAHCANCTVSCLFIQKWWGITSNTTDREKGNCELKSWRLKALSSDTYVQTPALRTLKSTDVKCSKNLNSLPCSEGYPQLLVATFLSTQSSDTSAPEAKKHLTALSLFQGLVRRIFILKWIMEQTELLGFFIYAILNSCQFSVYS